MDCLPSCSCSGEGIVLADVTAVWEEMLKTKKFLDVTGNGVNHPNDLGHRLYAQTLLGLLIEHYGSAGN